MAHGKIVERSTTGRDSYLELIQQFPLRPLRNDRELDAAVRVVDALIDRGSLDAGAEDYLDVLGDLVSRYEAEKHPLGDPTDADLLSHLLEARSITQTETARDAGIARSTLSAVLAGKRKLTRGQIEKLANLFKVAPAVFYSSQ